MKKSVVLFVFGIVFVSLILISVSAYSSNDVDKVVSTAKETVNDVANNPAVEDVGGAIDDAADDVLDTAEDVGGAIDDAADDVVDTAEDVGGAIDDAADGVDDSLAEADNRIRNSKNVAKFRKEVRKIVRERAKEMRTRVIKMKKYCLNHTFDDCPENCTKKCVSVSCNYPETCDSEDCNGPGSCYYRGIVEEVKNGDYEINGEKMVVERLKNNHIKLKIRNAIVNSALDVSVKDDGDKTVLYAKGGGKIREIKVMPDTAAKRALERLKLKNCVESEGCSIELKAVGSEKNEELVYEVRTQRKARLFGIFSKNMKVMSQVDAENGEVKKIHKPWWAFLASEPPEV